MSISAPFIELERFSTFGDLLKYLRRRVGLTQRELSIHVGYSIAQISRLELNQRLPDLAMIAARFAPALDLEDEPVIAKKLIELAATVRAEDAPASGAPPYKGLNFFDEADADLFFGRAALVEKLVKRVLEQASEGSLLRHSPSPARFLAIVGASGSGKSSVVRAGLVHALRWNAPSAHWPVYLLTPTAHPLEALALSLTHETDLTSATAKLMDDFGRDSRTLHLWAHRQLQSALKSSASALRLLLVVDQFEELFTLCQNDEERAAFVNNLLTAALEPDGPLGLIMTLRADFYSSCAPYSALRTALAEQQEYIGPMSAEELRQAIEEPARRGGWELEEGLADVILHDIGADGSHAPEPGAMPLLSHALLETWHRRRGRTLTLSGYLASGGVRGAIAETAETVFQDQLDSRQQAIARHIFLRLTALGDGEDFVWTRRRVGYDELIPTEADTTLTREVLTYLADARLITTSENVAEVAHEALLREWPRLSEWLASNRASLLLQRQLTNAAAEWRKAKNDASFLLTGARLTQFENLALFSTVVLTQDERAYLEASLAERYRQAKEEQDRQERELRAAHKLAQTERARAESEQQRAEEQVRYVARVRTRNRAIIGAGAVAFLLAVLAGLFGWQSSQNAVRAESEARFATSRELASAAIANLGVDPELSILLAIEAVSRTYAIDRTALPEAEEALHWAVGTSRLQLTTPWLVGTRNISRGAVTSPEGRLNAAVIHDNKVGIWDTTIGQLLLTITCQTPVIDVALSPDGTRLATSNDGFTATIWDAETGRELRTLFGHTNTIETVEFSPDGKLLATAGWDRKAIMWDAATGQHLFTLSGHTGIIIDLYFSSDGTQLVTYSVDGTVKHWDVSSGGEMPTRLVNAFWSSTFDLEHMHIATTHPDWTASIWDMATGKPLLALSDSLGIQNLAFSSDGARLVTTAPQHETMIVWDALTGRPLLRLADVNAIDARFSPDGKRIVTGHRNGAVKVWEATTGELLLSLSYHNFSVFAVAYSPDGSRIVSTAGDGTVKVWEAETGRELLSLLHSNIGPSVLWDIAFSPDGKRFVTGSQAGTAKVWDLETGQELLMLSGHTGTVYRVAYSPDGTQIATAAYDGTAKVWDATTGKLLLTLFGATKGLNGIVFSADGKRLITVSDDGNMRTYLLRLEDELALARSRLMRGWREEECQRYLHVAQCP